MKNKLLLIGAGVALLGVTAYSFADTNSLVSAATSTATTAVHSQRFAGPQGGMKGHGMMGFGGQEGPRGGGMKMDQAVVTAIQANDYNAFVTALAAEKTAPTQDEFNTMVSTYTKQQAVKTAITNGDYQAYTTATSGDKKVMTQDQFTQMVTRQKTQQQLQAAVKSNDFSAYTTAFNAQKAEVPTQTQFNTMVTQFKNFKGKAGKTMNAPTTPAATTSAAQ